MQQICPSFSRGCSSPCHLPGWSEGGPWALTAAAYLDPARLVHDTNIADGCYGAFGANWAAADLSSQDALGGRLALHFHPGFTLMYDVLGVTAKDFQSTYRKAILKAVNPAHHRHLGA